MMVKVLTALGVACMLTLVACSSAPEQKPAPTSQDSQAVSGTRLALMADDIVGKVVNSMSQPAGTGMVAIATPVDVSSLEQTDWLGRELAEQFVYSLHKRGIPVYEYKIKGWLEVTGQGDYIYSRNWQKLATKANVSRVLSGTLSRNDGGVMLYARLVNLKTSVVEGSGEIFIPYSILPKCYREGGSACGNGTGAGLSALYPAVEQPVAGTNASQRNAASARGSGVRSNHTASSSQSSASNKASARGNSRGRVANNRAASSRSGHNANSQRTAQSSRAASTTQGGRANGNGNSTAGSGSTVVSNTPVLAQVEKGGSTCSACRSGSGTVSKCHKDCYEAVTYPASTVGVGSLLVRDASGQSQYDRK